MFPIIKSVLLRILFKNTMHAQFSTYHHLLFFPLILDIGYLLFFEFHINVSSLLHCPNFVAIVDFTLLHTAFPL